MRRTRAALTIAVLATAACGGGGGGGDGDGDGTSSASTTGGDATVTASSPTDPAGDDAPTAGDATVDAGPGTDPSADSGRADSGDPDTGGGPTVPVLCGSTPPDGAEAPPPLPTFTGGDCAPVVPGMNAITTAGNERAFLFVAPSDLSPDESVPLLFMWHWLQGEPMDFFEKAIVQEAVDQFRFVAVIPFEKGDLLFNWPYSAIDSDARMQEEFVFFDDMLACVAASYPVDANCVGSAGVSSGALWTSQLASGRGEFLSAIMVMSGGTGGLVKPWGGSPHVMPAMVLWGGPTDTCVAINFTMTSQDLEAGLQADGHAILECVHNCGHTEPPFEAPEGITKFAFLWEFFLDHPYWLADGESPWDAGLPEGAIEWCAMGVGNATPREGPCDDGGDCAF
jgi:hypothetical protein